MTRSAFGILGLLALLALLAVVGVTRCEGTPPSLQAPERVAVGREGRTVDVVAEDAGAGVRTVSATLAHAGGEAPLGEARFRGRWNPFGAAAPPHDFAVQIDPKALGLKDGDATLVVVARDHSWRSWLAGNETRLEIPVRIDSRAPRISLVPGITYARRGGSVALAYSVSEDTARDGVQLGERFYRGIRIGVDDPAAQHAAGSRLVLFPLPIDSGGQQPVVLAEDDAGNVAKATPQVRIEERSVPEASLSLPPSFFENKIGELAEALDVPADDRVRAFQEINTRIRSENEAKIREVTEAITPEPLFSGAFEQLANSKVTSPFAEQRSYFVDGEKVSQSVHYGYDLASLAGAPITASNDGRVVHADALGIYGNCVIIDHGLGLYSLYGHLSSLDVAPGDAVTKGQTLGLSGQTGLAGGDHLHFAMLLQGNYVDPVEWWDAKWLRDRFEPKLEAARR